MGRGQQYMWAWLCLDMWVGPELKGVVSGGQGKGWQHVTGSCI